MYIGLCVLPDFPVYLNIENESGMIEMIFQ